MKTVCRLGNLTPLAHLVRWLALVAAFVPAFAMAAPPSIIADPQTGQISVETDRYSARLDGGTLTWLFSKLSKRALIDEARTSPKPPNRSGLFVEDQPKAAPIWLTPILEGDERSKISGNGAQVTFNGLGLAGKVRPGTALTVEVTVDPPSGDLLVTVSGTAQGECVVGTGFAFSGIMEKYFNYQAAGSGMRYPGDTGQKWSPLAGVLEWSNMGGSKTPVGPHGGLWNAPVTVLTSAEDPNAALAIWCEDDIPKYKLYLGGHDGVTYATYEDPPYDSNHSAHSVTWRVNVYDGGWTAAAAPFADSLVRRGFTKGRAPWAKDISVRVTLPNMTKSWIELMERTFPPEDRHHVILQAEDWRRPPFDRQMWDYEPRNDFKRDAALAHEAGFHTMVYFNPLYLWDDPNKITDEQTRDAARRLRDAGFTPTFNSVEEFRAEVRKMQDIGVIRDPLTLDKLPLVIVNPAYAPWQKLRIADGANVLKNYDIEGLYLDCAYKFQPDGRGRVDGMTVYEGMKAMVDGFRKAKPEIFLGSEMANELMARWTDFSLHMGAVWALNYELDKARYSHPIVNYLYRDVMGTLTHVQYPNSEFRLFHVTEEIAERTGQISSGTPFGDWESKNHPPETSLWLYKAKLFAHRGLRPWFPEKWEPNVMSYYKATDGTVFVFEETDYGSRFVERAPAGPIIHYARAWKTERVKTTDGEIANWIGRSDDGTWIGLDCLGTKEMGFASLDKTFGRPKAGRGYVLFPASSPLSKADPRLRISELPEGVRIANFQVSDAVATFELGATNDIRAPIRVVTSRPLVRVAAPGEPSVDFTKGAQNALTVPVNKPVALIFEEGCIAPFEYSGSFKVPLPGDLGIGPDSPAVKYGLGSWDQKWNAPLSGPVNPRPGTIYRLEFEAHKTGEKNASLVVALVSWGTQGDQTLVGTGPFEISNDKPQTFAKIGIRNTFMGHAWDREMGLRMFCTGTPTTPPAAQVAGLSKLQFIRPELGISDTNPILLGIAKAGQPSNFSPVRRVFNSQTKTVTGNSGTPAESGAASSGSDALSTVLYGTAHVTAPADKPSLQSIDDVGVELVGEQAALFELKGEHATADGLGIKLLGASGKSGLLGGPQPENESFSVRFRGNTAPGKYAAVVRVVTQAGNMGVASTGEKGMPLANLFHVDIPVTVEVRP